MQQLARELQHNKRAPTRRPRRRVSRPRWKRKFWTEQCMVSRRVSVCLRARICLLGLCLSCIYGGRTGARRPPCPMRRTVSRATLGDTRARTVDLETNIEYCVKRNYLCQIIYGVNGDARDARNELETSSRAQLAHVRRGRARGGCASKNSTRRTTFAK